MSNRRRKTRMPGITSLGLAAAAWALALLAGPTLAAVAQLAEDPGNGRLAPRQSDQYAMPATCCPGCSYYSHCCCAPTRAKQGAKKAAVKVVTVISHRGRVGTFKPKNPTPALRSLNDVGPRVELGSLQSDGQLDGMDQSPALSSRRLFARNLCPVCPSGVSFSGKRNFGARGCPATGGSINNPGSNSGGARVVVTITQTVTVTATGTIPSGPKATIAGRAFEDLNRDGKYTEGVDNLIVRRMVILRRATARGRTTGRAEGAVIGRAMTDENGRWAIVTTPMPNTRMTLSLLRAPRAILATFKTNSEGDGAARIAIPPPYISGRLYYDVNRNGKRDAGDKPVAKEDLSIDTIQGKAFLDGVTEATGSFRIEVGDALPFTRLVLSAVNGKIKHGFRLDGNGNGNLGDLPVRPALISGSACQDAAGNGGCTSAYSGILIFKYPDGRVLKRIRTGSLGKFSFSMVPAPTQVFRIYSPDGTELYSFTTGASGNAAGLKVIVSTYSPSPPPPPPPPGTTDEPQPTLTPTEPAPTDPQPTQPTDPQPTQPIPTVPTLWTTARVVPTTRRPVLTTPKPRITTRPPVITTAAPTMPVLTTVTAAISSTGISASVSETASTSLLSSSSSSATGFTTAALTTAGDAASQSTGSTLATGAASSGASGSTQTLPSGVTPTSTAPAGTTQIIPSGATSTSAAPAGTTQTLPSGATSTSAAPAGTTQTLPSGATSTWTIPPGTTETLPSGVSPTSTVPPATTRTLPSGATSTSTIPPGTTETLPSGAIPTSTVPPATTQTLPSGASSTSTIPPATTETLPSGATPTETSTAAGSPSSSPAFTVTTATLPSGATSTETSSVTTQTLPSGATTTSTELHLSTDQVATSISTETLPSGATSTETPSTRTRSTETLPSGASSTETSTASALATSQASPAASTSSILLPGTSQTLPSGATTTSTEPYSTTEASSMPTLPSGATETSSQVLSTSTPFTLPSGASTTLEPQSTSSAHSSTAAESSASETQTPFTTATEVTYTTETETSTLSAASIQTDLSTAHSSTVEPSPSESSSASASMAPETSSESMTTWTTATDMTYTTSISSAEVTSSSEMLHASTTSAVAPSTLTDAPTTETETTSTIVTTTSTPFAVIDGSIWSDLNLDGVQDSSDVPVAGETVTISDSNGTVLATGVTNSTGGFSIIYSPPASNATLRLSTASNITSGLFQTEVNGYQTLLVPLSPPGIEAGIWYDVNRDGISQVSEPTYSQAPVTVRLANGTFLFNTTTDTNGYLGQYATDIFPNTTIIFESENGVVLGNGTTNQFGAVFASIPLAVGIVEGSVFFDVSGNGVQDSGEAGLGNTMLNITLANGTLLGEVTTNSSGHFAFYTVPHPSTQFFIIVASDGTPLGNFTTDAMGDATVLLPLAPRTSTTAATAVTEVSTSLTEVPTTTSVTEVPTETTTESETTTVFATPTATSGALYGLVFQDLDSDGAFTLMVDIPVTVGSVEIFNSSGEVIASVPVDGNGTYYYLMTPPEPFTNFTVFWNSTVGMETVTDATGNSRVDIPIAAGTLRKRDLTNLGGLDPEVGSVEDTSPTSGKVTRLSDLPGAPGGPMRLANEEAEVAEKLLSSVKSKSKWAPTISRFGDRVWRVGQNSGDGPPLDRPFFRDQ